MSREGFYCRKYLNKTFRWKIKFCYSKTKTYLIWKLIFVRSSGAIVVLAKAPAAEPDAKLINTSLKIVWVPKIVKNLVRSREIFNSISSYSPLLFALELMIGVGLVIVSVGLCAAISLSLTLNAVALLAAAALADNWLPDDDLMDIGMSGFSRRRLIANWKYKYITIIWAIRDFTTRHNRNGNRWKTNFVHNLISSWKLVSFVELHLCCTQNINNACENYIYIKIY